MPLRIRGAERGFTAFTFDFSGWGASGGALRHWELPTQKARDMAAAVDFVSSLSLAGPRVGYLAVCATAQYALRAVAGSARIASLVLVAGWFHDSASVAPFYGGQVGVARRLERASDAQRQAPHGGPLTPPATSAPECPSRWTITPTWCAVR